MTVDPHSPLNKRCHCHCPEGGECTLRGDVRHELHICSESFCECHGKIRYAQAKRERLLRATLALEYVTEAK